MAARSATDALGASQGFIITLSVTRNITGFTLSSYTLHLLLFLLTLHYLIPLSPARLTEVPPFFPPEAKIQQD